MRILIVDDTAFMRTTLKNIVESEGSHELYEAEDGFEAVKKYKIHRPDMVIMDISMPLMDGIEAVQHIRKFDPQADIIICSLQGQKTNVMKAIQSGARGFIVKPVKSEKLFEHIQISKSLIQSRLQSQTAPTDVQEEPSERDAFEALIESSFDAINSGAIKKQSLNQNSEEFMAGVERGYLEARREIAMNMIRMSISLEVIKQCVELTYEEIESYKKVYGLT
jgi:two-component system chemotaxis response regulator CheY